MRKAYFPEPVTPTPEPTPLPAYFAVSSNPSGASVFLGSANTGKKTPASIEASPGSHSIGVTLSGYNSAVKTATAKAGTSTGVSFTLSKIPVTPTPTEPVTPTPTVTPAVPEKPWYEVLFGNVASFWTNWLSGNISARDEAANNIRTFYFGSPEAQSAIGLAPKAEMRPWELALSMTTIGPVVQAPAKAIATKASSAILEKATANPTGLKAWWKALTSTERTGILDRMSLETFGKQALEALQAVVLPAFKGKAGAGLWAWIKTHPGTLLAMTTGGLLAITGIKLAVSYAGKEVPEKPGFGVYVLIESAQKSGRSTDWLAAKKTNVLFQDFINSMKANWITAINNFDFITGQQFVKDLEADQVQHDAWETAINTGLEAAQAKEALEETQPEEIPGVPTEVPSNAGKLQVLVYDKSTNASINATLVINGVSQPYHLHAYNIDLAPGAYEIRVEEEGYTRYDDTIVIEATKVMPINVFLEKPAAPEVPTPEEPPPEEVPPVPTLGRVQVLSNVEATVWSAGTDTGYTTPAMIELAPGIYDITLKAEGYITETKTAYVKAGEVYSLAFLLSEEAAGLAVTRAWRLDIDSSPASAKILINYAFTGKYTPDYVLLDPGQYVVSLTKSGYKRWEQAVSLQEF